MTAEDVLAVQQLAVVYADALSRGDVDAAASTFAEDGRLETPAAQPAVGRAAVRTVIAAKIANLELIFQTVHMGLVVIEPGRARTRFPITEWARRAEDESPFLFLGWYEDQAELSPDGWRFTCRRLIPRIVAQAPFLDARLHPMDDLTVELLTTGAL